MNQVLSSNKRLEYQDYVWPENEHCREKNNSKRNNKKNKNNKNNPPT